MRISIYKNVLFSLLVLFSNGSYSYAIDTGIVPHVSYCELSSEACKGLQNLYQCAKVLEPMKLRDLDSIKRDGERLKISFPKKSKQKELIFETSAKDKRKFFLIGETEKYWIIRHFHDNHYSNVILVNKKSGEQIPVEDLPFFPLNSKYFVVVSFDVDAGYKANAFQIWRDDSKPVKVHEIENFPPMEGPVAFRWKDNDQIEVFYSSNPEWIDLTKVIRVHLGNSK